MQSNELEIIRNYFACVNDVLIQSLDVMLATTVLTYVINSLHDIRN